jgi:hypothetical protein
LKMCELGVRGHRHQQRIIVWLASNAHGNACEVFRPETPGSNRMLYDDSDSPYQPGNCRRRGFLAASSRRARLRHGSFEEAVATTTAPRCVLARPDLQTRQRVALRVPQRRPGTRRDPSAHIHQLTPKSWAQTLGTRWLASSPGVPGSDTFKTALVARIRAPACARHSPWTGSEFTRG